MPRWLAPWRQNRRLITDPGGRCRHGAGCLDITNQRLFDAEPVGQGAQNGLCDRAVRAWRPGDPGEALFMAVHSGDIARLPTVSAGLNRLSCSRSENRCLCHHHCGGLAGIPLCRKPGEAAQGTGTADQAVMARPLPPQRQARPARNAPRKRARGCCRRSKWCPAVCGDYVAGVGARACGRQDCPYTPAA